MIGNASSVAERRAEVLRLAASLTVSQIASRLRVTPQTVRNDLNTLGVKARSARGEDKTARRKADASAKKIKAVADRRRFRTTPVPTGEPARLAPADATGTIHAGRVFDPAALGEDVLKDGASNSKIGGDVLVGRLKGARIVTLTIEERATCPTSCALWRACYGNSMQHSRRWRHGEPLMRRIEAELRALCARHETVLVRLHILGDFWSVEYVDFWAWQLHRFPNLHVFGFTAWRPDTEIGAYIVKVRAAAGTRFAIRHSGATGPWGCFTINFPTERNRIGDAVVCPEQRDAMEGSPKGLHCGSCGLCWAGSAPIVFVEH